MLAMLGRRRRLSKIDLLTRSASLTPHHMRPAICPPSHGRSITTPHAFVNAFHDEGDLEQTVLGMSIVEEAPTSPPISVPIPKTPYHEVHGKHCAVSEDLSIDCLWEGLFSPLNIFLSGPYAKANADRRNFRFPRHPLPRSTEQATI